MGLKVLVFLAPSELQAEASLEEYARLKDAVL